MNTHACRPRRRICCARRVRQSRYKAARIRAYLRKRHFLRARLANKHKDLMAWKHFLHNQQLLRKLQNAANSTSFDTQTANWLQNLPVQGGAGGAAATRRKRERKQGSNTPQNVLRTLIQGLKQCLQTGTGLEAAVSYLENMPRTKPKKKKIKTAPPPPLRKNHLKFSIGMGNLTPSVETDGGLGSHKMKTIRVKSDLLQPWSVQGSRRRMKMCGFRL